ncbi:MAG: hypothetical protein ABJN14_07540 [Paracoccaceae bacterium]
MGKALAKNGKFFLKPPRDGSDFKQLFKLLVAAGAGRSVDANGFPEGPWTPELLTEAILHLDAKDADIELRTVQFWFQDNDRGISAKNIRWLARIFGCDDPLATSDWQAELSAAQDRLRAKRRTQLCAQREKDEKLSKSTKQQATKIPPQQKPAPRADPQNKKVRYKIGLAQASEAILHGKYAFGLPLLVFLGAVFLGLLSYTVNLHDVVYSSKDALAKQVGFLWAPNWTFNFLIAIPLYLLFLTELLSFWTTKGRQVLLGKDEDAAQLGWQRVIDNSSLVFWAVFLICLPVIGGYQWITTRLLPLMKRDPGTLPIDWGRIAIVSPDVSSVSETVIFTGLVWFYMGVCTYLYFIGLTIIYLITQDFLKLSQRPSTLHDPYRHAEVKKVLEVLQIQVFRCAVVGLFMCITMKLQSAYLLSRNENIVLWLLNDAFPTWGDPRTSTKGFNYSVPVFFTSFVAALVTAIVFANSYFTTRGTLELRRNASDGLARSDVKVGEKRNSLRVLPFVVGLLLVSFLVIGVMPGFSLVLFVAASVAVYGLCDPWFGQRKHLSYPSKIRH